MSPSATQGSGYENSALEPVAICGMACRLPGGIDSDTSFWRTLVEKRTGQTPKVPDSRFNIDAHYHENLDRPGSFNVLGGYFLDGRLEDFDPGFFNMTPIEAQWLDPQQRKMLEVSYECLVSAGVTLEAIAGSNTAVFVGSFTSDYQQISIRDPDFRHNYAATGVDPGIISNRIGHTFNLRGPSFTINTACSSSVYAIHNACHALRARDCDAAIAGGVNLILTVDQHMNTAKLGILSPTSTCHTFDASADGYGRAEGAGALFLKRLSDAIRDGDPIRGVIRSTAVNTNGKVDGMGITHPSVAGQERVIRMAYEKAQLNPNLTAYAELHGTGTPVGDPIEVRAVANAMNDTRSKDRPLLIGAVKPNIGHSEAASGIFAVMKAALMTESAQIPGVALFQRLNPAILEKDWNVQVQADTAPWPIDSLVRRASVSSFGYGGTNGHVIVESIDSLYPWYQHARAKKEAQYDHSCKRPLLLCVSAHDKATLSRNVTAIAAVSSRYYLADLAHTLNLHRTMFSHRAFTVALEGQENEVFEQSALQTGVVSKKMTTSIGFLFTGQGAQWAGMAKEALLDFAIVIDVIEKLDEVLSKLSPKPEFKIVDMLLNDNATNSARINEAEIAQPLCTAIQIALVDLLALWNIVPEVSIGHSSGEIGAAYAAGLISAPEAIIAAFCRGRAVSNKSIPGSMLAVGLGSEEVLEYLPSDSEKACIACENSPSSVTLSGQTDYISQLQKVLSSKGIFARELKTGRAYHSPHMAPVGAIYEIMLAQALAVLTEGDYLWRQPRSHMISSVTGEPIDTESLPSDYWSKNLRQKVRFDTAIQRLGTDKDMFGQVTYVVEIGPHSALSGPFKQICLANKFDRFTYVPSLVRGKNNTHQLLSVAGSLFLAGYNLDLEAVNSESYGTHLRKPKTQYLLVDLPPYQWNYEKLYWAEPRASVEQRGRVYPRHDLLGSRVSGLAGKSKVWRNVLRHRDVPWLKDHNLGGTAIFPAAGHLSVAIEALRQVHETEDLPFEGVTLRDIDIQTALTLPENDDGVEIMVSLETIGTSSWHYFSVESFDNDKWTLHCTGKLSASNRPVTSERHPVVESSLTQRVSGKTWYKAFQRVGFNYGKAFQQLQNARTDRSIHHAAGDVTVLENSGIMDSESRSLIHPSTVDACLQLIIISIHSGKHKEMPWGVVPSRIEEVSIFPPEADSGSTGHAVAWTDGFEGRSFNTNTHLNGQDGKLLVQVKNLTCITYEAALPAGGLNDIARAEPYSKALWKPDIITLRADQFAQYWPQISRPIEQLAKFVDLICHRQPVNSALLICSSTILLETIETVLDTLPSTCSVTIALSDSMQATDLPELQARATVITLASFSDLWVETDTVAPMDLVLMGFSGLDPTVSPNTLMPLVNDGGWLIGSSDDIHPPSLPASALQVGQQFAVRKSEATVHLANCLDHHLGNIALLSLSLPTANHVVKSLLETLTSSGRKVYRKLLTSFNSSEDLRVIIDDTTGNLLSSLDEPTFAALKDVLASGVPVLWLTNGVRQGKCAAGGMSEGFLRVVRSEQAAAKIVLLDVSHGQQPEDVSQAIIRKLESADTKESGHDTEFWLHRGILHIPRVYPNYDLNQEWDETALYSTVQDKPLPEGLQLQAKMSNGIVVFERGRDHTKITEDEVEIQTLASELRLSRGSLALVVGTIVRTGSSLLGRSLVGKRAIAFAHDGFRTLVRTSKYAVVDDVALSIASDTLVGALAPICRLISFCLVGPNKLGQGDRVFSLPGPKPIMTMMAILAKVQGWKLSIVVDSEKDRQQYISEPCFSTEGVFLSEELDAILTSVRTQPESPSCTIIAHEFSPLSQEVWRCIPGGARFFLLMNDNISLHVSPDAAPFTRGASFIPISKKELDAFALQSSLNVLRSMQIELVKTANDFINVVDVAELCTTEWNSTKQRQPIVVRCNYGESQIKVLPETRYLSLSANRTYLLVGCLGGLGRSLTRWMMEHGARHFAFISRTGADKPEAARVIEGIQKEGGSAQVFRADASDEDSVRKIVLNLKEERQIGGAVHAAMVLKDSIFEQMDYKSFIDAIKPKADGALSLHNALRDVDLDFFVMTSSISAVLGNMGQSNYSAANSFLDSLALQRNIDGLVGTSLVLPMVLGVGVVAENDNLETSLNRKGLYGVDDHEMLRGFEVAMSRARLDSQSHTQAIESQIIMGMDAGELAKCIAESGGVENVDAYWYNDARFCHIRTSLEAATNSASMSGGGGGDESFAVALKTALAEGPDAAIEVIAKHIAKRVSSILMVPFEDLELEGHSIASYGLDSMIGAEMRTWLFKEFGLDYPFQKLLAPTLTFLNLAAVAAETMGHIAPGDKLQ